MAYSGLDNGQIVAELWNGMAGPLTCKI